MSKFIDKIKIELREMKGYDISDIDLRWYTHDRITQEYERFVLGYGQVRFYLDEQYVLSHKPNSYLPTKL